MSAMTYFRAKLSCRFCGRDGFVFVESRLGDAGKTYEVGDCPGNDIPAHRFDELGFRVRAPKPGEPVHTLMSWTCETCGRASFADVVLDAGCVRAIDAFDLNPATLDRLHYISVDVEDMLQPIVGGSLYNDTGVRPDWLDALRAGLAAGRRWPP